MKRRRLFLCAIATAVAAFSLLFGAGFSGAEPAADPHDLLHDLGVVYLHGKGGWPGALNGGIVSALKEEGALVATPEMPWSFHRRYDATFDQALTEIDAAIATLKSDGARRIVLTAMASSTSAMARLHCAPLCWSPNERPRQASERSCRSHAFGSRRGAAMTACSHCVIRWR